MPAFEAAVELLSGLFRVIGSRVIEIVLEVLVKGLGYSLCRIFSRSVDPHGFVAAIVGVIGWAVIGVLIYQAYDYFFTQTV